MPMKSIFNSFAGLSDPFLKHPDFDFQKSYPNHDLSILSWSITTTILSFFTLTHLGVLINFVIGSSVSPFIAPIALLAALVIGYWLARSEGLCGRLQIALPAIILAIIAIALLLAATFFDMSWDGLWYQQTAVYQMSHGWNPLYDPMRGFTPHLQDWLRHYSKGPWYIALALFQTTHNIEWSKAAQWMTLAATFFAVFAVCIDYEMRRGKSAVIAALVSLNPVVTCQLASYLVDGLLVSFLACFIAAALRYFRRQSPTITCVMTTSAILCINAKFTGLVYLCFFSAAIGLYIIIKRRDMLLRYAALLIVSYLLGIFLFGYNPYVTNYVHRGHPFYPLMGTAAYPSHGQQGRDPVVLYETPKNMLGHNVFYRLGYAIFGRPGSQPFFEGDNARLMWPFDIGWKDINIFYFHEVRISGFGPLFSGAFIISIFLLIIAMIRPGIPRIIVVLFIGAILASLMISTHTWWARFAPHFWWLPIAAVIAGLAVPDWRFARWAAGGLAALMLVNATLVAYGHFRWEIEATRKTYEQLAFLRDKGDVEIDLQFFGEPFGERLKAGGVTFHATRRLQGKNPIELMSVAPGYPGAVRACVKDQ